MSPRRGGGCLGDALSCPPRRPVGGSSSARPGAPQPSPAAAAAWRSRAPAAAPGASQPPPPPGARGEGGGRPPGKMKAEGGDHSMINLSVQQVLSLWAHGTVLRNLTEMWYWIFLWALFSSLFVHGAAGVLMFVMLQRHRQGRVISLVAVSIGFLASVTGAMITSAAVAGIYRVAGKNMAPLEALVWGVGQTVLTLIISFSRILATL
ncbi:transmembrane protein 170B [Halichoerus grypus]|uniref:Transmembrane protein 170B n=1 Tax=Neomonachus schauinslandi TaxID=29088 RepID=A0A2Y9HTH4_NEOSC|nr:transmembrane protein 170B [Neomonachus schauinslandi]XP_035962442.1 transmembrane protein 170B isoform X1 [Halichoerus grypus]